MKLNNRWRLLLLALLAGLLLLPVIVVIQAGMTADGERWDEVIYRPFIAASKRSWGLLLWLTVVGGIISALLGTVASIWRFPLKGLALVMLGFPLILPPFIVAIGIQSLQPFFAFSTTSWLDGRWGCFWSGLAMVLPIAVYGTLLAGAQITSAEREVARIHRGTWKLFQLTLLRTFPVSLACAVLGSLLVIADPGAGQIMGYHGISGDILVAFSARNDFQLAAMKALSLLIMFGPLMMVVCYILYRRLNYRRLSFGSRGKQLIESGWLASVLTGSVFAVLCSIPVVASMTGLVRPLMKPPTERYISQAKEMFTESLPTTLFYGLAAGLVAVLMAGAFVVIVRRNKKMEWGLMAGGLVLLAIPSCISSLGMVSLGTGAPASLDFLFRSQWIVGVTLGLRFVPVALLFLLVANVAIPQSIGETASTYQLPRWKQLLCIHLPIRLPAIVLTVLIVMILTLADVSSIALLQPPGGASFGSHLFAVMDNASEKMIASLCVVYLTVPLAMLALLGVVMLWKNLSPHNEQ